MKLLKGSTRQGNIIFTKTSSVFDAFNKEKSTTKSQDVQLRDAALVLREIILSKPLPGNLTIDSVLHGTTNVPLKLNQFFHYLNCGPDLRRWKSNDKQHHIQSVSQDIIFAASSERKLPSKHLKLGVALKSLTGSRKVVEILNRYGIVLNTMLFKRSRQN